MIYNFLSEYLSIIIFLFIALYLSIGFIIANYLASPSNPDPEKLSAYECGFEPFDDSRMEFDVRFYLVAILFIIFDLRENISLITQETLLFNESILDNIRYGNMSCGDKEIAQGNRKAISKSNIMKSIATK